MVYAAALLLAAAAGGAAAQGVGSIITQSVFESMLPNRDNSLCSPGFYTYDAFITAANSFPAFGTSGSSDELTRRELAAFFGQTSHETTGQCIISGFLQPNVFLFVLSHPTRT